MKQVASAWDKAIQEQNERIAQAQRKLLEDSGYPLTLLALDRKDFDTFLYLMGRYNLDFREICHEHRPGYVVRVELMQYGKIINWMDVPPMVR